MKSVGDGQYGVSDEQCITDDIEDRLDDPGLGEMRNSRDTIRLKEDDERPVVEVLHHRNTSNENDEKQEDWPLP